MSSSPSPELDTFIRNFIISHARTIIDAVSQSQDHDESGPLIYTVYSNLREISIKEGPLPASKSAIDALPAVTVTEEEECSICLTEYGAAGEAKELPCKHRYHSDCIMKWLGIHGSCPVCRYEMPVDEEEKRRRRDGGVGWQVMITVISGGPVSEPDSIERNFGQSVDDMDVDLGSGGNWDRGSMEDLD